MTRSTDACLPHTAAIFPREALSMIRTSALALLLLLPPAAAAKTAADCDKIQNPHEFNLCLASQSPVKSRVKADRPPRPGMARARAARGSAGVERRAGGRKRMTFEVR